MRSKNRMHIFFVVLALVFWNPLCFYFIYNRTPVYQLRLIHFLFWFVFVCGMLILYLLFKNKIGAKPANVVFALSIAGILFSLIIMVDGIIGSTNKAAPGLLFEPGTRIRYHTAEFNCVAEINSNGLRDKEINAIKGNNYRILCVGDSWTFGWGVDIENSWPKKLEAFLKMKGIKNIEVINCGQPGRYITSYKTNLEKLLPALKPDLVLLGVLQLDDLAQVYEQRFPPRAKEKISAWRKLSYAVKTFLLYSVKNIRGLKKKDHEEINIKDTWKNSARSLINDLSPAQRIRYDNLDDTIKLMLSEGELTPGWLYYFINQPDRVPVFNDPGRSETKFAISVMNYNVRDIKTLCEKNNAGLVFINLPVHYFTGHKVITGTDSLDNWLESNNKIDPLYRSLALKNAVPYFEMTKEFRGLEDKSGYFFRYDGHPNIKGYEKIAGLVGQYLIDNTGVGKNNR